LDQFVIYTKGGSSESLKRHLRNYNQRPELLIRNFKLTAINNPAIIEQIKSLLECLGIPKNKWKNYFDLNLTIYVFLQKLSQEGHVQVTYILSKIDEITEIKKSHLILGASFLGTLGLLLAAPFFPSLLLIIGGFLSLAVTFPILGLLFSIGVAAYQICNNLVDKKNPFFDRARDISFRIVKFSLTVIAYSLLIAKAVVMTSLAAAFFLFSTLLDVVKEVLCLVQESLRYNNKQTMEEADPLTSNRTSIRHEFRYKKHRDAAIINLLATIVLVGILMTGWFVPGFLVTVGLAAAMILTQGIKYLALRKNEQLKRERLQEQLNEAEKRHFKAKSQEFENKDSYSSQKDSDFPSEFAYGQSSGNTSTKPSSSYQRTPSPATGRFSFFHRDLPSGKDSDKASCTRQRP